MSDSAQAQPEHHQPQVAVSSTGVYNPLMPGEEQPAAMGGSVVEDLMSVYESMTKSKTPHPHVNHQQSKTLEQHAQFDPPIHNQHYASPDQQHQMQPPQQSPMVQQYSIPDHVYPHPQQVQAPPAHYQQQPQQQMYNGFGNYQQQYAAPAQTIATVDQQEMPKTGEVDSAEVGEQPRGRKKRKTSASTTKGRKKGKNSDGRWSKRFTWPEDLHRDFVSAIFDVGLKHSSPSTIIEHMPKNPDITTERVKSHLQKYRLHRQKSKQEFMSSYEASLSKFQEKGVAGVKSLTNAEAAAYVTHCATIDPSKTVPPTHALPSQEVAPRPEPLVTYSPNVNEALMLPQLTEAEKKTPIGASMGYLMGLFFSLKQQLDVQRGLPNTANPVAVHAAAQGVPAEEMPRESSTQANAKSVDSVTSEETPSSAHPASRNIEANSHMKRDMQNQMAFQNKMRALKQQELNKSKKPGEGKEAPADGQPKDVPQNGEGDAYQGQVAGESGGHDGGAQGGAPRNRMMSIGGSDEFWNTDVVDEQLFEFLMNH